MLRAVRLIETKLKSYVAFDFFVFLITLSVFETFHLCNVVLPSSPNLLYSPGAKEEVKDFHETYDDDDDDDDDDEFLLETVVGQMYCRARTKCTLHRLNSRKRIPMYLKIFL